MSFIRAMSRRKEAYEGENKMNNEKLDLFIFTNRSDIFLLDRAFYNNEEVKLPWENHGTWHKELIASWETEKEELKVLFQNRKAKQTLPLMVSSIAKLIQFVYWANNIPVDLAKWNTIEWKFAPVNFKERMDFIFMKPTLHHSFIQLGEMFVEFEKIYEKALALKKL